MTTSMNPSVLDGAARLFRIYFEHCQAPGPDTLFNLLTALHSLSDRLHKASGAGFLGHQEFVALKTLRNFAHHRDELRANIRVILTPAQSDLSMMCVVRRDQVEKAIADPGATIKRREEAREACEATFHWYGPAVNINPCLFNLTVRVYEDLDRQNLLPESEEVERFSQSYDFEEMTGASHFISGKISAHAADIETILSAVVADMPPP